MNTETLTYEADGLHMKSQIYYDPNGSGQRAGGWFFPKHSGWADHAKSRAERLAGIGYIALTCALNFNPGMR
jgi:dienelactone hydrolase